MFFFSYQNDLHSFIINSEIFHNWLIEKFCNCLCQSIASVQCIIEENIICDFLRSLFQKMHHLDRWGQNAFSQSICELQTLKGRAKKTHGVALLCQHVDAVHYIFHSDDILGVMK